MALIIMGLTMGMDCPEMPPWLYPETPDDVLSEWDGDGDGISTAVEMNDANAYLSLDTTVWNDNISLARGYPCNGWIDNAFNLVNSGTGYYHFLGTDPVDYDDWGVLHLIDMIEGAGRGWYEYKGGTGPRMGVGDLSQGDASAQQFGGYWSDHSCHQNGLEVDIRYLRNDGQEVSLNVKNQASTYDTIATIGIMNALFDADVEFIVVSPYCGIEFYGLEVSYDSAGIHDDHFHVRIIDPDGTEN